MIYYIIPIVIFLMAAIEIYSRSIVEKLFGFVGLLLILFAGLRTVGPDYVSYQEIFSIGESYNRLLTEQNVEPGFALIVFLTHPFGMYFFVFVTAAIGVTLNFWFIKKYSPYLFLSVIIYYSTTFIIKEFAQIRHGVAIGIILMSFHALFEGKNKKFLLLALLAAMFHYSAVCILPCVFFSKRSISNRTFIILLFILLPFVLFDVKTLLFSVLSVIPLGGIQQKVIFYLDMSDFTKRLGIDSSLILRLIVFALLLIYRDPLQKKYAYINCLINLYFIGIFYYMAFNSISEFALRTSIYFRVLDVVVFPYILSIVRLRIERLILCTLLCLNAIFSINKLVFSKEQKDIYTPYNTILQE